MIAVQVEMVEDAGKAVNFTNRTLYGSSWHTVLQCTKCRCGTFTHKHREEISFLLISLHAGNLSRAKSIAALFKKMFQLLL